MIRTITRVLSLLYFSFSLPLCLAFSRFLCAVYLSIYSRIDPRSTACTHIYIPVRPSTLGLPAASIQPLALLLSCQGARIIRLLFLFCVVFSLFLFFFSTLALPILFDIGVTTFLRRRTRSLRLRSTINRPLPPLLPYSSLTLRPTVRLNPTSTNCLSLFLPCTHRSDTRRLPTNLYSTISTYTYYLLLSSLLPN